MNHRPFSLKSRWDVWDGGKGDDGPILLGAQGLSHRIEPYFYPTVTYSYTAIML